MNEDKDTITVWCHPEAIVQTTISIKGKLKKVYSCYGKITYREWCELETKRMNQVNTGAYIATSETGDIAIKRK